MAADQALCEHEFVDGCCPRCGLTHREYLAARMRVVLDAQGAWGEEDEEWMRREVVEGD